MATTATRNGKSTRQKLTAEIQNANDAGVKILGEWHNYSKWCDYGDVQPEIGDLADVVLDKDGWIMAIAAAADPYAAETRPEPKVTHRGREKLVTFEEEELGQDPGRHPARVAPRSPREAKTEGQLRDLQTPAQAAAEDKERRITRLAALKAAAELVASQRYDEGDPVEETLRIARELTRWAWTGQTQIQGVS